MREGGRHRSALVNGSGELAKKVERKKLSLRDENRHLDIKKEINYKKSALIHRYWTHYVNSKLRQIAKRASSKEFDPNWVGSSYAKANGMAVQTLVRETYRQTRSSR